MREITITENEAGQRINKFLLKYLNQATSSFVYKMLRKKNIKLNGAKAEGSEILSPGDTVQMYLAEETIEKFRKSGGERKGTPVSKPQKPLDILFENDHILAVNKPVGILSQKANPEDYSINEMAVDYLGGNLDDTFKPSICNRLDRNTSGIILVGKTLKGSQGLSEIIRTRRLDKHYTTIVRGNVPDTIDSKSVLVKDAATNKVTVYNYVEDVELPEGASIIHTIYTPVKTSGDYTLLDVKLITGKSHQIRADLAHLGYYIIGDGKYGDVTTNRYFRDKFKLRHQLLHCGKVVFHEGLEKLPELGGMVVEAPAPGVFKDIESIVFS